MRRYLVAAGSSTLLLSGAIGMTAAQGHPHDDGDAAGRVVVATGLDNPRQLTWAGDTLLVAEGGQGGDNCTAPAEAGSSPTETTGSTATTTTAVPTATETTGSTITATTTGTTGSTATATGTAGPTTTATTTTETTTTAPAPTGSASTRPSSDTDDDGLCDAFTGRITAIDRPLRSEADEAETLVGGLYSVEGPLGSIGPDGVAATGFPGVLLIAQGEQTADDLAEPGIETDASEAETQEHLLISVDGDVVPWVDLGEAERELNPDGKTALDSNPNAVIVVDPSPHGGRGDDEYALVADAGANAVWKVTPDFDPDDEGLPTAKVTVFAAFPADDDETTPEFVPSALAQDRQGRIYVGGVGSLAPGAAEVVRFSHDGEQTARWSGFTGINGLAVDDGGEHVYVSQILGDAGDGNGNVIRVDTRHETWTSQDVPFPSGLALADDDSDDRDWDDGWQDRDGRDSDDRDSDGWDADGWDSDDGDRHDGDGRDWDEGRHDDEETVFVSAFSTSPADADAPATTDVRGGGQVWRFSFPEDAEESPLPVTRAAQATATSTTATSTTASTPTTTSTTTGDATATATTPTPTTPTPTP
jgi:hypothetical protein